MTVLVSWASKLLFGVVIVGEISDETEVLCSVSFCPCRLRWWIRSLIVKLVLTSYWQASRYQRDYSWVKPLCQQRLHFLQQVCKVPCKGLHLSSSGRITFSQHVKKVKQNIGWCIEECNWYPLATRNKGLQFFQD